MPRCRTVLFCTALTIGACTMTETSPPKGMEDAPTTSAASWKASMEQVGEHWKVIEKALKARPIGSLEGVARSARESADLMRHGYGQFEDMRVPGFAGYAREAESWLLRISLEARQGNGDLAADLYRTGKDQYCGKCHEAAKPIFGW